MFGKLYRPRNILSAATHYGGTGAVIAGGLMIAQPWALGAAALLTGGLSLWLIKRQKDFLENDIAAHPEVHKFSPRLGQIAKELYTRSGIRANKYPLYDFRADEEKAKRKNGLLDTLFQQIFNLMSKTHNAAALRLDKTVIMISEPALKLLDDEEEKAVLAHEFAHAAARHQHLGMPQKLLAGASNMANKLTVLGATLAAGWLGVTAAVAATVGVLALVAKKHSKGDLIFKDDEKLNLREIFDKKRVTKNAGLAASVLTTGILTYFNPAYLPLYAAATGLGLASGVLSATFSRSMEYQADRGAVELGANPLALITSLRKMTVAMEQSRKQAYGGEVPQPGYLTKFWKQITSTHPTLERRMGRLADIARKQGFGEDAITKATKGPIQVSKGNNIPYKVIRELALAM